ncbi:YlxR family protein [Goodfellowiella coeruleoviolacea]|uniref:YlxR family protein n=1 Tax=Goodfellowiella coeruleoviolacea TaxID=334858 RepID=UPI0027DF1AD8|nr:YlxR family protein [Goodfellowiella coeruleoviolacea]
MRFGEIDCSLVQRPEEVFDHVGPVRTCVGCRTRTLSTELLRVVVVDAKVIPDTRRRLPGRGAWLHPNLDCLRAAERRRAFPRALRAQGQLDVDSLRTHLEQLARWSTAVGPHGQQGTRKQVDPS